jgi:amino acid adenylation domain-containing protein
MRWLHEYVRDAAASAPGALAVRGPDGAFTYADLDARANRVARALVALGVGPGDRVAVWLPKSAEAVAALQGVLRAGAAYVPVDPLAPAARVRVILGDCGVKALIAAGDAGRSVLHDELSTVALVVADGWAGSSLAGMSPDPVAAPARGPDDLAYILYTSGSTGKPKGVCITNRNATAFVEWAARAFEASSRDRFSNHAPFHFDLSVLDLYAAFAVGASVSIVPEGTAYSAGDLVRFMRDEGITIWYSVPSAIVLMMEHGGLVAGPPDPLRVLLFAGEAFPMKHLRRLREAWPDVTMWNLYGPTETNVCTAFEVGSITPDQTSLSIGAAVCGDRAWVRRPDGSPATPDEEGELVVEGPTVFPGYWGQPAREPGPYGTGDIVRVGSDGNFAFLGRRDNMVKVRGHRVELGDVESALVEHPSVHEAAALVIGEGLQARLVAFVGCGDARPPTLLEVKRHCAERLPRYMIPDDVESSAALPRNRNGKIDRGVLKGRSLSSR